MNDKDLILKTMVAGYEKDKSTFYTSMSLRDYLFPDYHEDEVAHLITQIMDERPELLRKERVVGIPFAVVPTGTVKPFLESGGFTKIANDIAEEEQRKTERERKTDQLLDLDLDLKKFESRIGKKVVIAGILFTILNFAITLATIEFSSPDNKSDIEPQSQGLEKGQSIQNDSIVG